MGAAMSWLFPYHVRRYVVIKGRRLGSAQPNALSLDHKGIFVSDRMGESLRLKSCLDAARDDSSTLHRLLDEERASVRRQLRSYIIATLGACLNCRAQNKERTLGEILFKYSRRPTLSDEETQATTNFRVRYPALKDCENLNIRKKDLPLFCDRIQLRARQPLQTEILLRTTSMKPPRALQTSERNELLDPTKASCLILA